MPDRADDPVLLQKALIALDDLIAAAGLPLPDDERAHGWTDREWAMMLAVLSNWRSRIIERGFLSSTDSGWQVRALLDFDAVDTSYGAAKAFVALAVEIGNAVEGPIM